MNNKLRILLAKFSKAFPITFIAVIVAFSIIQAPASGRTGDERSKSDETRPLRFKNVIERLSPSFEIEGFSFMPGVGFIDFDNDGFLDVYAVNGKGNPSGLFRSNQDGSFTNVAARARVTNLGQGTGVAVGDLNNDGFDDMYVANGSTIGDGVDSNDGPDRLYINNRNGTFREIAVAAGIREDGFNTSVAFFDYNKDGLLDIVVGRWVDFDFNPASAGRDVVPGAPSRLYRNNGNLTFTDVSARARIGNPRYNTWAIACFDYDNDDDVDVLLAYERGPIDVYRNNDNGTFTRVTERSGDVNAYGAWMGLAVGDYDNDGNFDIYSSNISDLRMTRDASIPPLVVPPPSTWDNPRPTLFRNNGDGTFTETSRASTNSQFQQFSWGCAFADFDNDGWQDITIAMNLAPVGVVGLEKEGAGPGRLLLNNRDGLFTDLTHAAGITNLGPDGNYLDGRGLAIADFNKDGAMDIFLQNVPQFEEQFPFGKTLIPGKGKPKFFKNQGTGNNWIELKLVGTGRSNLNAVGAKIVLTTRRNKQYRTIFGGGSIYGASSRIVHFGLGDEKRGDIEILWPDGRRQQIHNASANRIWTVVEGHNPSVEDLRFEDRDDKRSEDRDERRIADDDNR
jgi:enediyne biosynthesis protein E4